MEVAKNNKIRGGSFTGWEKKKKRNFFFFLKKGFFFSIIFGKKGLSLTSKITFL